MGTRKATHPAANVEAREAFDLFQMALRQPGVRELMDVYERWQQVDAVAEPYREAMAVKKMVAVSNSSYPAAW